jgi:DNA end-binding protein Ku
VPRPLWSGAITFGLVNAPVRVYSAIHEHRLQFHLLHRKDDSPVGYEKVCKKENKPVPDDEIVKAFEYSKGEYVYMEDDDFEAARVDGTRTIDITDFVPYDEIDPIYFARSYYVGPAEGAEHVYTLLARAMEQSGLAGIAKFVMRDRQHLGALRVHDGVIVLEQLYFADEIRSEGEIKPTKQRIGKQELELAAQLIDSFAGAWKPEKYKDTYRDALLAVVEAKRKGREVHEAPETEPAEEPVDLMTALRESIERSGGKKPASSRRRRSAA